MQAVRVVAHYNGATVISASAVQEKEAFKTYCSSIFFQTTLKPVMESNVDKPIYISVGKDDMETIFLGPKAGEGDTSLISQYLTSQGLTRDCFVKLTEKLESVFGKSDTGNENAENDGGTYEYPEPEVDSMRLQRDAQLVRYLADVERKEAMLAKMNANTNDNESKTDSETKDDVPEKRERKERSSRK